MIMSFVMRERTGESSNILSINQLNDSTCVTAIRCKWLPTSSSIAPIRILPCNINLDILATTDH